MNYEFLDQTIIDISLEQVAISPESNCITSQTIFLCPFNVKTHSLVLKFQILEVWSQEEDINKLLFKTFKELIVFSCPSKENKHFKFIKSQIFIVLSLDPEAIIVSSSDIEVKLQIVHSCPIKTLGIYSE